MEIIIFVKVVPNIEIGSRWVNFLRGCFNMKMLSCQHRNSHNKDKTVSWPSYLTMGIAITGKKILYWYGALVMNLLLESCSYCDIAERFLLGIYSIFQEFPLNIIHSCCHKYQKGKSLDARTYVETFMAKFCSIYIQAFEGYINILCEDKFPRLLSYSTKVCGIVVQAFSNLRTSKVINNISFAKIYVYLFSALPSVKYHRIREFIICWSP